MVEDRSSPEGRFQSQMDRLKDSTPYKEKYESPEMQQLIQAIDIVVALRREIARTGNRMIWEKLLTATEHLQSVLKKHIDTQDM